MCLSIILLGPWFALLLCQTFYTILVGTPEIKEPLSEHVNDDFWEIVKVNCRKKVGSGVELYVKSQKGRYASVCVCVCVCVCKYT